jgi:hypothetical protein
MFQGFARRCKGLLEVLRFFFLISKVLLDVTRICWTLHGTAGRRMGLLDAVCV